MAATKKQFEPSKAINSRLESREREVEPREKTKGNNIQRSSRPGLHARQAFLEKHQNLSGGSIDGSADVRLQIIPRRHPI
jgi:hypothetical protein